MYQQRFKNSLTHLSVLKQAKVMLPFEALSWSVISGSTNVLFIDQITEVSCRGWWWFMEKRNIPLFIGALSSLWNLVWLDLGGWMRVFKRLHGCLNVKATPYFHAFSKIKAHQHQLAFKCSSGLLMQSNRPQPETQPSLITSTLIIYSTLFTNPWKFHGLKLSPKRLHPTIIGCILFFNLRCLWAFEAMHIKSM